MTLAENSISKTGTLPIEVNKDVVRHLSLGLYRNFALSIKELISNSYDAEATEIKIKLDLKNKRIVVRDNGKGMDFKQFKEEYLRIGYYKEPSKSVDELGRMRIGTFGIGFLAPLPYCKLMKVITKKKGDTEYIEAEINAENFFRKGTWDIREEEVHYEIKASDLPKEEGETIVVLEDIKPQIAEDLTRRVSRGTSKIDKLSGFEKFKWTLSQYAPIRFPPDRKDLRDFFEDPKRTPMRLWLDAEELFRNVPNGARILEKDEKGFGDIYLKYTIMSPYDTVKPEEARGLQLRLRDVAIGFPRDFDVTKLGRVLGKLNFICGEVCIVRGLDSALMVTRDAFNYTEEVAEIYQFFREKLTKWDKILYNQADEDRNIYESIPNKIFKSVTEELKKADIIRFPKERLRLKKAPITERKTEETSLMQPLEKLKKSLEKRKDYKIISSKEKIPEENSPIIVNPDKKSILVYEEHPAFQETIKIGKEEFKIGYEEWDHTKTPYAICKIQEQQNKVIFNNSHPLFKTKLSNEIIKRLSLGILLILRDRKDKEELLEKANLLLDDVFGGG